MRKKISLFGLFSFILCASNFVFASTPGEIESRKEYWRGLLMEHDSRPVEVSLYEYPSLTSGEARRELYVTIDRILNGPADPDDATLIEQLDYEVSKDKVGFRASELIRVLYLARNGAKTHAELMNFAHDILDGFEEHDVQLWLKRGKVRNESNYFSENHMFAYTASSFLLRQFAPQRFPGDPDLDVRLETLLDLKLDFGFYEHGARFYHQVTLGALLNLAQFSEDQLIKEKATILAGELISDFLPMVNDQGNFCTASAREPSGLGRAAAFDLPKGGGAPELIAMQPIPWYWIITGRGASPTTKTRLPNEPESEFGYIDSPYGYATPFLLTSDTELPVNPARFDLESYLNYRLGHDPSPWRSRKGPGLLDHLPRELAGVFHMNYGGYAHPDVIDDIEFTVKEYEMSRNRYVGPLRIAGAILPNLFQRYIPGKSLVNSYTDSSVLSRRNIDMFKKNGVALSSFDSYYPGHAGYEQVVWAAAVGGLCVYTQSGRVNDRWVGETPLGSTSMPEVEQKDNMVLVSYFPDLATRALNNDVHLHFSESGWDEKIEYNNWIIARTGLSYIAVYRHGRRLRRNGFFANGSGIGVVRRQVWAAIVESGEGPNGMTFSEFVNDIKDTHVRERFSRFRRIYTTSIVRDGKTLLANNFKQFRSWDRDYMDEFLDDDFSPPRPSQVILRTAPSSGGGASDTYVDQYFSGDRWQVKAVTFNGKDIVRSARETGDLALDFELLVECQTETGAWSYLDTITNDQIRQAAIIEVPAGEACTDAIKIRAEMDENLTGENYVTVPFDVEYRRK